MTKGSVNSIESMGLVDGPGIRCVVFLNGCKLRCKYCHNPETWTLKDLNTTPEELVKRIIRFKPYYKNKGGVTFSGGEPLLQPDFLIECSKLLKKENIHVALDTAGCGIGKYDEILENIDLVILDIKHTDDNKYKELTGNNNTEYKKFIEHLNKSNKKVWIRQVVIPNEMDNDEYLKSLKEEISKIKNVEKVEFLPYHKLGREKYIAMNIPYPMENIPEMDKDKCDELYKRFLEIQKEN